MSLLLPQGALDCHVEDGFRDISRVLRNPPLRVHQGVQHVVCVTVATVERFDEFHLAVNEGSRLLDYRVRSLVKHALALPNRLLAT